MSRQTMAEVIRAHVPTTASNTFNTPESGSGRYCRCGHFVRAIHSAMDDNRSTDSYLDELLAAHVAGALAEAGYGDVHAALLAAADDMPIETLAGADGASVWLRTRAHGMDPDGRALVAGIHERLRA